MKQVNYKQCGLEQNGSRVVGWIEERGAKLGARVEIDELGGLWEVVSVGDMTQAKSDVHKKEALARQPFTAMKSYRKAD